MGISWQQLSYEACCPMSHLPHLSRFFALGWKQITNLSGGEKTLASLSLVFALHHYRQGQQIPSFVLEVLWYVAFQPVQCKSLELQLLQHSRCDIYRKGHVCSFLLCVCYNYASNEHTTGYSTWSPIDWLDFLIDRLFISNISAMFPSCHATETIFDRIYRMLSMMFVVKTTTTELQGQHHCISWTKLMQPWTSAMCPLSPTTSRLLNLSATGPFMHYV